VNLALVSEFGSSYLLPLRFEYTRAAEMILLGKPFDALRAAEFGLVTQVVPDQNLLATATETARTLGVRLCSAGYQATDEARFTRTIGASSET
jgi:enoyl-CoA hydratase/carnithine racemase